MIKGTKEEQSNYMKEWYQNNKEQHQANTKALHHKRKKEVIEAYGGKCSCCGETEIDFLAIDHIENNGAEHRKETGNGTKFHRWIRANNFPDRLQVLCHNCNFSKFIGGGICVHKRV